jgi:hypothetical protein
MQWNEKFQNQKTNIGRNLKIKKKEILYDKELQNSTESALQFDCKIMFPLVVLQECPICTFQL